MPPTNLKERIAALEQRNAANRPTSPTAGVPSGTGGNAPHAPGFRDKIAKFEKKGGVPVPRGRFGLGAPPTVEGPRKQGELYGNRIPAPVRHVSAGAGPTLSAASDDSATSGRRAFSLSHFNAEFDEEQYSRSPSPSFQTALQDADAPSSPLSAPESTAPTLQPTETSASKSTTIIRGTSFQKAMELARNVENAKLKSVEQAALRSQTQSPDVQKLPSLETADSGQNTPVIVLSAEDTPSVVLHSSPVLGSHTPSFTNSTSVHPDTTAAKSPTTESEDQHVENADEAQTNEGPSPLASDPSEVDNIDTYVLRSVDAPSIEEADSADTLRTSTVETIPVIVELEPEPQATRSPQADVSSTAAQLPATPALDDTGSNHSLTPTKKTPPTLESDVTVDDLMSPLSSGNISTTTLADALTDYFKPESLHVHSSSGTVTPPALPTPASLSPAAKLAYDALDSELSIIVLDQPPLLSPIGSISSAVSADDREVNSASVSQATRVTPTTGRGVPLFLPSNAPAQTRKSDFVYFPPTPEAVATEFSDTAPKVEKKAEDKHSFRTVVHGKVLETAPGPKERLMVPETPQAQRFKRTNTFEPPPSPGQGELAALWYEAALLESSLEQGELPSESGTQDSEAKSKTSEAKEAESKLKSAQESAKAPSNGAQNRRSQTVDGTTSASLKHTFLAPLSRAKTSHRKEVSASATTESFSRLPVPVAAPRPKSAFVPDNIRVPPRPVTPENNANLSAHSTPSKSPKQRFASFRRIGSINMSRPSTMYSTRHSQSGSSEISSEDSPTVLTPVDQDSEFGQSRDSVTSEFGQLKAKVSTPSLSSKKSASSSMSRATSFAGKMWSRARTKSNGSTLSTAQDDIPRLDAPLPDLPNIQLPHLPHITAPPPIEKGVFNPPQRAASLKHPMNLPPLPSKFVLPLPTTGASAFFSTNSADVSGDSLVLPDASYSSRPSSWASFASTTGSSLPQSPLFDESFINSFPTVPETTTLAFPPLRTGQNLGRSASVLTTVKERPSLDTAVAPTSAQEAGENWRDSFRSSSRSATPTPR